MTDWFTSDPHHGHENIIRFCKRPFKDVKEMNYELVKRWNERVQPGDRVFVIGDFAFLTQKEAQNVLDQLVGEKHLVKGNHDKVAVQLKGWASIRDLYDYRSGSDRAVLCHYPMRVWNKSHHGSLMLHGHCHGTVPPFCNQSLDVGVDCWDFRPVTLDEIKARLKQYPSMPKEFEKGYGRE